MKRFSILLMICFIIGCSKDNNGIVPEEEFVFKNILKSETGLANPFQVPKQQLIIKTLAEWKLLLSKMNSDDQNTCKLATADLNFDAYSIVAVIDEVKGSTGYVVTITNVVEHTEKLIITIKYTTLNNPTSGPMNTQPFHIIKIHKTNKPIEFN